MLLSGSLLIIAVVAALIWQPWKPVLNLATVSTSEIGQVSPFTASLGGYVSFDGNTPVLERGIVYDTILNPSLQSNSVIVGEGTGSFNAEISDLRENTTYYARAYATNKAGTAYGQLISFTTPVSFANYTETTAGLNLQMVAVKGGTFLMGSPDNEAGRSSNEYQHPVTLSNFYIGKYEVTFEQYDIFCNATGRTKPSDAGWGRGKRPVINVSWEDADAFCKWLSAQTGKNYRLPTEAEWEYAARAGTTTPFHTGNCLSTSQANYDGNYPYGSCSKGQYREKTLEVGSFNSNAWGLHDVHGNVWEWCEDWYAADFYKTSGQTKDPVNNTRGSDRVLRGGGWHDYAQRCRVSDRLNITPGGRDGGGGFRLALAP